MRTLFLVLLLSSVSLQAIAAAPPQDAAQSCRASSRWGTVGQIGALATGVASLSLGTAVGLDLGRLPNPAKPLYNIGIGTSAVGLPVMALGGTGMLLTAHSCTSKRPANIGGTAFILASTLAAPAAFSGVPFVRSSVDASLQGRTSAATVNGAVALTLFAIPLSAMFVALRQTGKMRNLNLVPVAGGHPGFSVAARW